MTRPKAIRKWAAAITPDDVAELERFGHYLRLVTAAERLGVPRDEACEAIYPDVWPEAKEEPR